MTLKRLSVVLLACLTLSACGGVDPNSPLGQRKATAAGDGFADGFPIDALAATLKGRQQRPQLGKADWISLIGPKA